MNQIKQIYKQLLKAYGPQGWWPVTTDNAVFEIITGAILTQNTAWKNVEKAIENLKKNDLVAVEKIRKTDKKRLALLIRSAGYYNQKAERLIIFAEFLSKNPIKKLMKEETGKLREKLLAIKGIGDETADSILLYAFNKPVFVIDAYTKRIFKRVGYKEESYEELQALFMKNLKKDARLFNEYHALLVELGKNLCKKRPSCGNCPLKQLCKREVR